MTSFSPWLRPTLLGPLLTLWILTTVFSLMIGMSALTFGYVDQWLNGMLLATFFGCTLSVILLVADMTLLKAKVRRLPQGAQAWLSSVVSPLAVFFIWQLPFVPMPESVLGLVAFLFVPMFAAAFAVRFVFGNRP